MIQAPLFLASVSLLMTAPVGAVPTDAGASWAADREREWRRAFRSGERYARTRDGRIAFALVDDQGRLHSRDGDSQFDSASVVKGMLLVAYLRDPRVRDRPLDATGRLLLRPMIVRSDNRSATLARAFVGNPGLAQLARDAGMTRFASATAWGATQITASDQARYFARLDRLVPQRHRSYALGLLRGVVPSQRWGIPAAMPSWVRTYLKGGWRPEPGGWVVHQVALLERGGRRAALAVLTDGDRSDMYGHATVEGIARRVMRPLARP